MTLRLRIFIFNLVTLATAFLLVALLGYKILESAIIENTYEKLSLIRVEKIKSVENYFRDIITAADLIATNEAVQEALTSEKNTPNLQSFQHIDEYARSFNLLDLLLIRPSGSIVYSSSSNIDPHTKIHQTDTHLGRIPDLFAWGLKAKKGNFLLLDFSYDDQQSKQSISYLASPVFKKQDLVGILLLRIGMNQIDQITSDNYAWSTHGLGKTGETLLYGEDWGQRNTSRFVIEDGIERDGEPSSYQRVSHGDVNFNRLNEQDEIQERGRDYRGVRVFRSMGKLHLPNGDKWYIQVKMDEAEAFLLFRRLLVAAATAAFVITIIFFVLSYAATRQVVQPIQLLIENLERLGIDNLSQKINYQSNDELGTLVSKYNQMAERLERTSVSKQFLDSVIASLKEYLFIVRVNKSLLPHEAPYQIIQANASALEALSLSGFEIRDKDLRELILSTPEFDSFTWLLENRHSVEADLLTPQGRRIPVLVTWSLLAEQRANDLVFVFACTDITETRANELALIKAREEAINASLAKSEFLALMSHEIRTPLNAMIGMNEVLRDSGLNNEQKNMVQISSNAGENLLAIINDILDLSKIEARQVVIEKIAFNIYDVATNVCEILAQKARIKNLDLKVSLHIPKNSYVMGDPTRIRQVLLNLIGNAIKFTDKGTVELEVVQGIQNSYKFLVHDSGSGIPETKRHLIFKSFSQADSSITRRYGGTGLGLSICKNLVERMGGQIDFKSNPGLGSTFFFSIPLPATNPQDIPDNQMNQTIPLTLDTNIRILVVDDIDDNRFLIKAYLKRYNCEVAEAANGAEAVDMLQIKHYDLIFMDVQMPIMDGYAATRQIRIMQKNSDKRTLIVALSANALSDDIQASNEAGCDDYIAKPIKKDHIHTLLSKHFNSEPKLP